jgi:hypothetical protein
VTPKTIDPWIDYRKENGEFRRWLHVWSYGGDPGTTHDGPQLWYPWAPLPWVLPADQPLNGETLTAMKHMGVTARWPAEWPRFDPDLLFLRKYPIYGMILPTSSEGALLAHLRKLQLQSADHADYMQRLNRRYVLFPKLKLKERVNENSRSAKDRIPFV